MATRKTVSLVLAAISALLLVACGAASVSTDPADAVGTAVAATLTAEARARAGGITGGVVAVPSTPKAAPTPTRATAIENPMEGRWEGIYPNDLLILEVFGDTVMFIGGRRNEIRPLRQTSAGFEFDIDGIGLEFDIDGTMTLSLVDSNNLQIESPELSNGFPSFLHRETPRVLDMVTEIWWVKCGPISRGSLVGTARFAADGQVTIYSSWTEEPILKTSYESISSSVLTINGMVEAEDATFYAMEPEDDTVIVLSPTRPGWQCVLQREQTQSPPTQSPPRETPKPPPTRTPRAPTSTPRPIKITIELKNEFCFPQDYYVDGELAATVAARSTTRFSTTTGTHQAMICYPGTPPYGDQCGDEITRKWTASTSSTAISADSRCDTPATITLRNKNCTAQDFYIDGQFVVWVAADSTTSFTVMPGVHRTQSCTHETTNCGHESTQPLSWSTGTWTIRRHESCGPAPR